MQARTTHEEPILARARANVEEAFRIAARLSPRGRIEEADGLVAVATGSAYPALNATFVTRPLADPEALAECLVRFYARAGVPGQLVAAGEHARFAAPLARAAGLVSGEPIPGMLLSPIPEPPTPPAGLAIRVVDTPELLRLYTDTLARGFGAPRDLLAFFDNPAILAIPGVTPYLGFVDGTPVATALHASSHRIAGVYNVATLPEYGRRGLGAALTWRAVTEGRAEGCVASFLQSSEMALPMYERMGYRRVMDYRTWMIPAPAESRPDIAVG